MSVSHYSLIFFSILMIGYYYCCFSLPEALFSIKINTTRHTQEEYLLRKIIAVLKLKEKNVEVIPEHQDPEVYMNAVSNKYFLFNFIVFVSLSPHQKTSIVVYKIIFFLPEIFSKFVAKYIPTTTT